MRLIVTSSCHAARKATPTAMGAAMRSSAKRRSIPVIVRAGAGAQARGPATLRRPPARRSRTDVRRMRRTPATAGTNRRADTARRCASTSTMRPGCAAITTTRVDRNTASWMLCVTNTTVNRCAAHNDSSSTSRRWRVNSSSAPNGSSISSRSGSGHERARDRYAHLHAARQLARQAGRRLRRDRRARARASTRRIGIAARRAGEVERQADVRARRVAHGISVGDWNTNAMRRPSPPVASNVPPHQRSCPADGRARPAMRCSSVDLPQPDGPTSVRNSPATHGEVDAARAHACRCRRSSRRPRARRSAAPATSADAGDATCYGRTRTALTRSSV